MARDKILNICLNGAYTESFSYQDNLLPKYQQRLGYDVVVVAPTTKFSKEGRYEEVGECEYITEDGVRVVRLASDNQNGIENRFRTYSGLYGMLETESPDVIFLHGPQFRASSDIARYVKAHKDGCKLYVDNHADYSNSASNFVSKYILHRIIWRYYARKLLPVTEMFWGVMPARVDFLIENYHLPAEKCGLLLMGADDDEVKRSLNDENIKETRRLLGFSDSDFVVVTGGKIDSSKRQTITLMNAVRSMPFDIKLLVFGPVDSSVKKEFNEAFDSDYMVYIPWANASESYDYFAIADIVCFPGRHSVYWEQAAAMGRPLVLKRWDGTEHINICKNVVFLDEDTADAIVSAFVYVKSDFDAISKRAKKASSSFLYSSIARKSVDPEFTPVI